MTQHVPQWSPDSELPGFEVTTLDFPDDYAGPVQATLVRRKATTPARKAFLYIHGYLDYFYQAHLADECNARGFNFYALDLRKYGRSLREGQRLAFCKDVREYFPETSASLLIATEQDQNDWVVLSGHSTGGLTSALYADEGAEKGRINALFLNSPFFDFNLDTQTRWVVRASTWLAPLFPYLPIKEQGGNPYMESIHADHRGEWAMDSRYRPMNGLTHYAGWFRAISRAHQRVRGGLSIACPVLVMHSDKTVRGKQWRPDFQAGDGVLNVEHIREGSRRLGPNVKVVEIQDGLHDLVLSRSDVRERVFDELFSWLDGLSPPKQAEHAISHSLERVVNNG